MGDTLFVKSYGCQMNVYDSARIVDVLSASGFTAVEDARDADVIILNTCHIREKATEKVFSELGRLRVQSKTRGAGPRPVDSRPVVVVAGCVAQAEGGEILKRSPFVDVVVGPQSYHGLPQLIADARRGVRAVATEFPVEPKFDLLPAPRHATGAPSAFLTVQEGCDKFCAFCVVPYTRGAEYSRPVADVLEEAKSYLAAGARQIMLLGQNVNCYHGRGPEGDEWTLAHLIARLADIEGLERIRYTTSYPADIGEDLIAAHRDVPKLAPYLHLPVQSGSDRILAAMKRRHTRDEYRRLVERLRRARPDLALSSDFIVGFPGETDEDFRDTLALVEEVGFAQAYSFKYSARPGTPAALLPQLDDDVKRERLSALQALLDRQQFAFNEGCVGRILPVLFDREGRRGGQLIGQSPYLQAVHVDAFEGGLGAIVPVEIVGAGPNSLAGRITDGGNG